MKSIKLYSFIAVLVFICGLLVLNYSIEREERDSHIIGYAVFVNAAYAACYDKDNPLNERYLSISDCQKGIKHFNDEFYKALPDKLSQQDMVTIKKLNDLLVSALNETNTSKRSVIEKKLYDLSHKTIQDELDNMTN